MIAPPLRFFAASLLVGCLLVASANAAGTYHKHSVEPSDDDGELQIGVTFTVWIPDGAETLRGVIVHQHGCGEGACRSGETAATDLHWQTLAKKWDCALLSPRYHQAQEQNCRLWCDPRNGSGEVFVQALEALAKQSGHPELATVPWCLWGHSGGGFWSSLMQMDYPQRIVAIWFQSGTAHSRWVSGEIDAPTIPEAAMGIPMIACPGYKERGHQRFKVAYNGCYEMVRDYRHRGAPIAFAPDPKSGHETRDGRYLAIPFFDACLKLRLPDVAGAATLKPVDLSEGVYTPLMEDYSGAETLDPIPAQTEANWLPSPELAAKWAEFIRTGEVSDATPPPAPFDLRVDGNVLRWNVAIDPESGLGGFIIYRDGKEIGRLPVKPNTRFGRPLFQGNTYHDTPDFNTPEMKFVDPDTSGGRYEVVAVNAAGLKSEPGR
jgi:hypothetical protein